MYFRLYVVHGSHPCAAVEKAMQLKGLPYSVVEWPPVLHAPLQRLMFGARTVPALRIGREKVSGSRAIMRRLEHLVPAPSLLPADAERRAAVEDAERWGDETFQPVGRELIWAGFVRNPAAMLSYGEHSQLALPPAVVRRTAPLIARAASRVNRTDGGVARRAIKSLPAQLDKVDAWIDDGTLGGVEQPNAADLQIASTIRLLLTMADVRPLIAGRPCAELATGLFPQADGELPAGSLPTV